MRKILAIIAFLAVVLIIFRAEPQTDINNELSDGKNNLNFWGIYDLPEVYQPVISEFEKNYPKIKINYKQFADADEYHQVLIKQLEKGKGPDIFLFRGQDNEAYADF